MTMPKQVTPGREDELNKKLAEWRWPDAASIELQPGPKLLYVTFPDGTYIISFYFTIDLNACLKHLAPRLLGEYNVELYSFKQHDYRYYSEVNIWKKGSTKHGFEILHDEHIAKYFEQGEGLDIITPLVFCRAIEKMVDEGKHHA